MSKRKKYLGMYTPNRIDWTRHSYVSNCLPKVKHLKQPLSPNRALQYGNVIT